jgi:hypothetical protein
MPKDFKNIQNPETPKAAAKPKRGGLAPWQERPAKEMIDIAFGDEHSGSANRAAIAVVERIL